MSYLNDPAINRAERMNRIVGCYSNAGELIKKSEDTNDIEKGGEGSKGGKVIGHTKSGKPIYENHNHPSHKEFNSQDDKDAAEAHNKFVDEHMDRIPKGAKEGEGGEDEKKAYKHVEARDKHMFRHLKKNKEESK
jgi:hypothetical protein